MQTVATSENVMLSLPCGDMSLLRSLSKKKAVSTSFLGWTIHRQRKSGKEKGLEDIRKGNVYHAKNSEDLIKQIPG